MPDFFAQFAAKPDGTAEMREVQEAFAEVSAERVAAVYAEALLDAAQGTGRPAEIVEEFDSFVTDVLDRFPQFERVLASALVSHEEKVGLLDRTLGGQASRVFLNFLKVVSRHGRMEILRAMHRAVRELWERRSGRVPVWVSTAAPLDEELARRLVERIRPLVDGQPVIQTRVDPALLGGIVVRVGDTVYDASLATQLKNLRQQMVERSAHEIQSRRDRFRFAE